MTILKHPSIPILLLCLILLLSGVMQGVVEAQSVFMEDVSGGYSLYYYRIVKPPLPEWLLAGWVDIPGYLVTLSYPIEQAASCNGWEIETKMSNNTAITNIAKNTRPPTWSGSAYRESYLLISTDKPVSAKVKCLHMQDGEQQELSIKTNN